MPFLFLFSLLLSVLSIQAQSPEKVYRSYIRSVKLYRAADQTASPVLYLGQPDQLELHFDDMEGNLKPYYYTLQLCNADWTAAQLPAFDYLKGFLTQRIQNYRVSSGVQTRYMHYQVLLPERNSGPTRGGNYLLKVFLNDDTSQLVFTRRIVVVNKRVSIAAQVLQPFSSNFFLTHQRLSIGVTPQQMPQNAFSPQEIKVVILQNDQWHTARTLTRPTIFRGNYYEYSDEEQTLFAAGQEWRWFDLRSIRLRGDRIQRIVDSDTSSRTDVFVQTDSERSGQLYLYYRDLNGKYLIENLDNPQPHTQGEYGWVHFSLRPAGGRRYSDNDVFVTGEWSGFELSDAYKMDFDDSQGLYTKAVFLKQGFYNYGYLTKRLSGVDKTPSFEYTEGNFWATENEYSVFVYFRPFGARADELIGYTRVRSGFQR
ncbi:MAG: DUF5103 domain-containing protein [Sphingomonadales bacterium]|nr:DUF5103 domain-containing protein [Sphingomonadales bacterium]